jgi:hypothetical protein
MKTRTTLFATTALVATLAAAGAAFAHSGIGHGMGPGIGMGMGPGMGPGACQMQQPGAQCPQGAGPAAGARQGMGPGMGMSMGMGPGMRGAPAAANLADVKTTLKITAEQEGAWNAYTAVVTRHAEARANMHEKMQAQFADPKATQPDRSAMQETMLKFRQEMQAQRTAALKDLYAVLTPEQKALADQNLGGMGFMQGHRMTGPKGGGRMGHPVGYRMGGRW